jgi:(p)ppGpp synthase/HD superfamily hydrolase
MHVPAHTHRHTHNKKFSCMHTHVNVQVAEEGISAHWIYKEDGKGVREAQRFTWLRQLVEWVQQLNDPQV